MLPALAWAAGGAEAQVDPRLLRERWTPEPHWAETFDKPIYIFPADLQDSAGDVHILHWDSEGRVRFDRKQADPSVWIGYKLLSLGVGADLDLLDHLFWDIALAPAVRLGSLGGGWSLTASAGAGTSNDGAFRNTDALYAVGTVEATHPLDASTRWRAGLNLDGNRLLLPNVPLPYIAFESEADPDLLWSLGTLRAEIVARPWSLLTLAARWEYPVAGRAAADLDLGKGWALFAEANRRMDGFHQREQGETRLFYLMHTAEAGVRWRSPLGLLSLSGGAAFAQRFDTGYDLRDRRRLDAPESGPMIALTLSGTF